MYGDVVGQRGKWMHFFQRGLHHNKALKWLYYAFGPYCLDVCAKNLWPRELSFLLSYVWLEWTIIVIWGWCIAFMWHCIIGLASCWFINACRKLVASWKPILYFGFYWWVVCMVVTFHKYFGYQTTYKLRCSVIPQIHFGLFLPLNIISN
jgi:hypothetical protein